MFTTFLLHTLHPTVFLTFSGHCSETHTSAMKVNKLKHCLHQRDFCTKQPSQPNYYRQESDVISGTYLVEMLSFIYRSGFLGIILVTENNTGIYHAWLM
jgi:hypothetical protein